MGEKFRNVVCEPGDVVADIKRQILELISLNQTICGNLPDLSVPNLIPEVPDLNPSQKVMDFLLIISIHNCDNDTCCVVLLSFFFNFDIYVL